MTAEPYEFSFEFLKQVSRRIVNEVEGVSRVTYDITSKPPGMYLHFQPGFSVAHGLIGTIELE
jgi:hypothetical protein